MGRCENASCQPQVRVVVSPRAGLLPGGAQLAALLGEETVLLAQAGVPNLSRQLSQAEVHALRRALLGLRPGDPLQPRSSQDSAVASVVSGRRVGSTDAGDRVAGGEGHRESGVPALPEVVAVVDHANLTWRSPLFGPNDEALGPRFPVMAGLYLPERVIESLPGWRLVRGAVAQVGGEEPNAFERSLIERHGLEFVSCELAPVAIVAAHLGYRLAAALLLEN